jgi:hypothetical protein
MSAVVVNEFYEEVIRRCIYHFHATKTAACCECCCTFSNSGKHYFQKRQNMFENPFVRLFKTHVSKQLCIIVVSVSRCLYNFIANVSLWWNKTTVNGQGTVRTLWNWKPENGIPGNNKDVPSGRQANNVSILVPGSEHGYFVSSWWRTPLHHPPKVTIGQ